VKVREVIRLIEEDGGRQVRTMAAIASSSTARRLAWWPWLAGRASTSRQARWRAS